MFLTVAYRPLPIACFYLITLSARANTFGHRQVESIQAVEIDSTLAMDYCYYSYSISFWRHAHACCSTTV
jgi:hypothetical protein